VKQYGRLISGAHATLRYAMAPWKELGLIQVQGASCNLGCVNALHASQPIKEGLHGLRVNHSRTQCIVHSIESVHLVQAAEKCRPSSLVKLIGLSMQSRQSKKCIDVEQVGVSTP